MKKLFFALALITTVLSSGAFAQRRDRDDRGGSVVLRDGRSIVRINVGDDRDDREMMMRIRRLEQAVRDLQDQVYQLQSQPQGREIFVCSGNFFSVGVVLGKAFSQTEARAKTLAECKRLDGGIFCKDDKISCERSFE